MKKHRPEACEGRKKRATCRELVHAYCAQFPDRLDVITPVEIYSSELAKQFGVHLKHSREDTSVSQYISDILRQTKKENGASVQQRRRPDPTFALAHAVREFMDAHDDPKAVVKAIRALVNKTGSIPALLSAIEEVEKLLATRE